jgi:hypothetical protein
LIGQSRDLPITRRLQRTAAWRITEVLNVAATIVKPKH